MPSLCAPAKQACLSRPWASRWRNSLPFFEPSSLQYRHRSVAPPPLPPAPSLYSLAGRWGGLSVCNDGCDLQCRRAEPPHAPGQVLGSPPFFAFGWGRVRRRRWGERVLNVGGGGVSANPRPTHQASLPVLLAPRGKQGSSTHPPAGRGVLAATARPPPRHLGAKLGSGAWCPNPPPLAEYPQSPSPPIN